MKKTKMTLLAIIILINSIFASGCWNYREVDKFLIVAGMAIDKGTKKHFQITVEIMQTDAGNDTKMKSKIMTAEGDTVFDAVRNMISISGKRLYWSHTQVIILSKEIASEGVIKAIEWFIRDAEPREDTHILISEEASAKEIFDGQATTDDIKSLVLDTILTNQVNLTKAPIADVLRISIELKTKGISAIAPSIKLIQIDGKMVPQIMGTAIIKSDKLVGFLNGDDTKDLIFIRNEVKDGLLIEKMLANDVPTPVSLEIFKSKTKVKPVVVDKNIKININIDTIAAIGEISGKGNFIDDKGRMMLERNAENTLKKRIGTLIKKIQSEYDTDIFGFGSKLRENNVKVWNSVENNWEEHTFKNLKVDVEAKVHIKNSAMLSKSFEEGECK